MVITLYIYSVHERMKVWMKKTTIYQFEEMDQDRHERVEMEMK